MNAVYFRYWAGCILLVVHSVTIGLIATSWRFDMPDQQISSVLMVVPITLVYALAFLKYVVATAAGDPKLEAPFNLPAVAVMLAVIIIFSGFLLFVVVRFVFFSALRVDEFKMWLGLVEAGFGGLVGLVFERLFGVKVEREKIGPG